MFLLGIATIGTAWSGYQASRWNQDQGDLSRQGSDLRVEANRQFGLATQRSSIDANLLAQYAKAVVDGDAAAGVLPGDAVPSRLPAGAGPVAAGGQRGQDAAEAAPGQGLLNSQLGDYEATQAKSEGTTRGKKAGEHGDDYVLITVLLAAALFFAGVTTSFKLQAARLVLLSFAALLIAYCISRVVTLPVT